jgi:tetratricopeptide (TPR) repeat protein
MKILSALSYAHSLKQGHACHHTLLACEEMEALLPYVTDPQTRWLTVFRLRVSATFSYQTYRALRLTAFQQSAAADTGDIANIIEAHKSRGFVLYQLGKLPEAFQCLDEGLNIARHAESQGKLDRHRPPWSLAMLSKMRIQVLYMLGRFEDALSAIQNDYDHAHCVGAPQFRAMVCMWVGKINLLRRRPVIADEAGKTIITMGQQENLPEVESLGKFFCDWAEWKRGDTEAAITALKQTIRLNQSAMASNILLSFWHSTLGDMYYSVQQFKEALKHNSEAIQAVRLTRVPNRKADTYRMRANILAAMKATPTEVIRVYDLSIKTSLKQSALMYTIPALIDKITYLQTQNLSTQTDLQQLREVIGKVQVSSDFAPLAVAQSLLNDRADSAT